MLTKLQQKNPGYFLCIKNLKSFAEEKYPIVLPNWDPSIHISGIQSYSLGIYPKLNLPLYPPTTMLAWHRGHRDLRHDESIDDAACTFWVLVPHLL